MSMLVTGWGLVVRRALHDRLIVGAAFVTVVLATALLAAVPIYGDAVALSGLRSELLQAQPDQAGVAIDGAPAPHETYAGLDRSVTRIARSTFAATGVRVDRSGQSGPFTLGATGDRTYAVGFRDGLASHSRLLAGQLGASGGARPLDVAVEEGSGLGLGRTLSLRSSLGSRRLRVRVTAVFRRIAPRSVYWGGDDSGSVALLVPRSRFATERFADSDYYWQLTPRFDRLAASALPGLRRRLDALEGRLNAGRPSGGELTVYTDLDTVLADASDSLHSARASVLVPSAQLAVLAVYVLIFTAGLLLGRRTRSVELLRLRGATPAEIVVMSLMEAALIALPAAAVAPWLSAWLLRALNVVGPLASVHLSLRPEVGPIAYALSFAAAAVAIAALTLPALRARRVAVATSRRRLPLAGLAQRSYLDLALAALALLGYWQLRRYRAPVVEGGGSAQLDPFGVAAPALLLLAGGLVALRVVPLAARLADRALSRTLGVAGALGPAQLARRPRRYTRAGLLLVLAVAIGIFAAAYAETWDGSQRDQAAYRAGADVRVEPSGEEAAPPQIGLPAGYRSLDGVTTVSPAVRQAVDYTGAGSNDTFLALDAGRLPAIVRVRSDFASRPLSELSSLLDRGSAEAPALELPGRPTRIRLTVDFRSHGKPVRDQRGTLVPQELRPSLYLSVRDRAGIVYQVGVGSLTRHRLTAVLAPRGSSYPPDYPLSIVSVRLNVYVPYLEARTIRFDLRSLEVAGPGGWRRVALGSADWRGTARAPRGLFRAARVRAVDASGDSLTARLGSGSLETTYSRSQTVDFMLQPGPPPAAAPLRVLANDAFLTQTDARVGEAVDLPLGSGRYPSRIVGSVHRFPTTDPDAPLVVADLRAFEAAALRIEGTTYEPDEWWLGVRGDGAAVADRLRAPPWSSLDVVSRAQLAQRLHDDPLALGAIGALALGFVAAAAFAALGFALAAGTSVRERLHEYGVLRSLGVSVRELAASVLIENGLLIGLSLLAGTGLGLLVSWLVLPSLTLGAAGGAAVPPVHVSVSWQTVAWIEAVLLGALVAISSVQVWFVGRLLPAPLLRAAGGEAPA